MKNHILFAGMLSIVACCMPSCKNSTDKAKTTMESPSVVHSQNDTMDSGHMTMDKGMMQPITMMMDKMKGMKISADFDLNFAHMMIIHHQGAVDMAQIEITKGTDENIKKMAQDIITDQSDEIKKLQDIINDHKHTGLNETADETHNELNASMTTMMAKMKNMQMTGNTDKDFALMMIPHHESAIDMATLEIIHGHHVRLKLMAQKMIADQKKEIEEFKSWLSSH